MLDGGENIMQTEETERDETWTVKMCKRQG